MNVHALDIPEPEAIPAWLDRHVVGPHLAALVAELVAVHGDDQRRSLDDVLGDRLDDVLANGLAAAGPGGCADLLRSPRCLLELQERIVADGGPHWDTVADSTGLDVLVAGGWKRLHDSVAGPVTMPAPARPRTFRTAFVASLLSAVATVLVMLALQRFGPLQDAGKPGPWGWNRPGAMVSNATADEYLSGLADSADEWFRKRPETASDLAARIIQFRHGCSTVMLSTHEPLSADDQVWLKERCAKWAEKLDAHLADLEAGTKPAEVRAATDETITALTEALRKRAAAV